MLNIRDGHVPEALNSNWLILKLNQFICEERSESVGCQLELRDPPFAG